MRSFIYKLYNEEIRDAFQLSFGIRGIKKINQGDESFTYRALRNGEKVILKIVHGSHREKELILGEVDWVKFLSENEVSVSIPLISENGVYVESKKARNNTFFHATLWKEAPGCTMDSKPWSSILVQNLGKLVGRMHSVTSKYKPYKKYRRPEWNQMFSIKELEKDLSNHKDILEKQLELNTYLESLPKPREAYGLIHADIEAENIFVKDNQLMLIDFDDCQYNWFVFDIAVILRASTWQMPNRDKHKDPLKWFFDNFMKGYLSMCKIGERWLRELPIMLRVIELRSFIHALTKVDRSKFSDIEKDWFKKSRELILKDKPMVDINRCF